MTPDLETVLRIHHRILEETGGSPGLRDPALLESALARPWRSYGGVDLYPTVFHKAAALLEGIARNHAFVDGNKRLAITLAMTYLRLKGYQTAATDDDLVELTIDVVTKRPEVGTIAARLEALVRPIA